MPVNKIKILAVSGSLRDNSSNTSILRMMSANAPANVDIILYKGLCELPHFIPTPDDLNSPEPVKDWRRQIREADAVLICTPEYAFGVPGVLKNALDWTVSSGDFDNKAVAIITASSSGDKAHASLLLTFQALNAKIAEGGTLLISFIRSKMDEKGEVSDPATLQSLQSLLGVLIKAINK
jgi:NAD(P)H-dependent FMN reductase